MELRINLRSYWKEDLRRWTSCTRVLNPKAEEAIYLLVLHPPIEDNEAWEPSPQSPLEEIYSSKRIRVVFSGSATNILEPWDTSQKSNSLTSLWSGKGLNKGQNWCSILRQLFNISNIILWLPIYMANALCFLRGVTRRSLPKWREIGLFTEAKCRVFKEIEIGPN